MGDGGAIRQELVVGGVNARGGRGERRSGGRPAAVTERPAGPSPQSEQAAPAAAERAFVRREEEGERLRTGSVGFPDVLATRPCLISAWRR